MAELDGQDVANFTGGRLDGDDDEVLGMLAAALIVSRRHCGWHVSPVKLQHAVTIDGPGSRILYLPTRKLVALNSVAEDGVDRDLARLSWSVGESPGLMDRPVAVRKRGRGWWSAEYASIAVNMDHGYTETEAGDWRWAVLSMVDQMSMVTVGSAGRIGDAGITRKTVDDVTYAWAAPYMASADEAKYSVEHILCDYALPRLEFL